MKKLYIVAALLMASTAAHAGNSISFDIEGHHIHIAVPRHCSSLSCLQISAPGLSGADFSSTGDDDTYDDKYDSNDSDNSPAPVRKNAPAPAMQAAAPAAQANAPQQPTAAQPPAPAASTTVPSETTASTAAVAPAAPPVVPAPVAPAPVASAPAPVEAAAPVSDPNSPIGVWATEENKGNVRIEPCGPNLCGYAVKTGEKILISMKPSGSKWSGRIHDPDSGSNYDSTIAMKGANALKVRGCAFGGMFCGGQTWKRVS
ncbi:MAG: DUF2147 domain-containing protein [Bradyrhizobium sp.]|nr:DUF2147 domain-containing protein [Bradyrhizobium sp.]